MRRLSFDFPKKNLAKIGCDTEKSVYYNNIVPVPELQLQTEAYKDFARVSKANRSAKILGLFV